ncbi:polymer-forming cytoskeletal protein [Halorhodospira abdelmalekii]|uniref:polymer-forming cytoskeletal protein n=1 Tax=Halorhodospira abdelmalekii TaxID=421629 RepID=UPI0019038DB0
MISDGTRLVGELTLESNLHLDGQIKGTVISDHDVSIGRSGRFEGNIKAERLIVSGFVEGVIDCTCLEIVAEGRVFGELHSDDFVIEPGGQFLGESHPRREVPLASLSNERSGEARLAAPAEAYAPVDGGANNRAQPQARAVPPPSTTPRTGAEASGGGELPGNATKEREEEAEGSPQEGATAAPPRRTTWGRR